MKEGLGEHGSDMVLAITFDISACNTNRQSSVIDFKALGAEQCWKNMFYQVSLGCAQTKEWAKFNAEYTMEGGIMGQDCGQWSLSAGYPADIHLDKYLVFTTIQDSAPPTTTSPGIQPSTTR